MLWLFGNARVSSNRSAEDRSVESLCVTPKTGLKVLSCFPGASRNHTVLLFLYPTDDLSVTQHFYETLRHAEYLLG